MPVTSIRYWLLTLLLVSGCSTAVEEITNAESATEGPVASTPTVALADPVASSPTPPVVDTTDGRYDDAIALAGSTAKLVQQAQSPDDWSLIVSRWQRTLAQLNAVPVGDPNYAAAQEKQAEYERNLAYAEQQLAQLSNPPEPIPIARTAVPVATAPAPTQVPPTVSPERFTVPILSRRSGTPVILVQLNNGLSVPMILDTGASRTVITRSVAAQLGLDPTGQIIATTASDSAVALDTTEVMTITVGGITRSNVTVAIKDAGNTGLLGNDFHRGYDISIRANTVEFNRR